MLCQRERERHSKDGPDAQASFVLTCDFSKKKRELVIHCIFICLSCGGGGGGIASAADKSPPKQMVEEMNEKMRKKLGPEHKDMADTVVKTQERLRNTSMCFILTLSKNGLLTQ